MSEQADAMLQLPNSYNFKRETASNYRSNPIDAQRFQMWVRNDMYRSSYAHNHSPVLLLTLRIRSHHDPLTSLGMGGSSLLIGLKAYLAKDIPIRPRMYYVVLL